MAKDKQGEIDVDNIIERLLSVRGSKPGKNVNLTESEVRGLCVKARDIFISQPILLELEAPLKICGAILYLMLFQAMSMDSISIS